MRLHEFPSWAQQVLPRELAKLRGQLAAGEQAEAERLAVEELQATTAAELADLRRLVDEVSAPRKKAAKPAKKAPAKKVAASKRAPAAKKARAAKGDPEEAALKARSYQPPEATTT